MIDPIELYSKPKPVAFAGLIWKLGIVITLVGLYLAAASLVSPTTRSRQAMGYPTPYQQTPSQPQYANQPAPAPAPMQAAPVQAARAPAPAPMAAPGPSAEERFEAARAQIVEVLLKGPSFHGKAYQTGKGESEVAATLVWDDATKIASGEIAFLTFGGRAMVQGNVVEDGNHPGKFVLQLKARTTDCYYFLAPTPSGELAGDWRWGYGHASGTISLYPGVNPETAPAAAGAAAVAQPAMAQQTVAAVQATAASAPQAPAAVQPAAFGPAAVPAGTIIEVETTEEINPGQLRTWHGKTTAGFDLNNGKTVDAGAVAILQLVRTGNTMGMRLEGVRFEGKIVPVKSDVQPLNVNVNNDSVVTQSNNTATVHLDTIFRRALAGSNKIAVGTPYTFTAAR